MMTSLRAFLLILAVGILSPSVARSQERQAAPPIPLVPAAPDSARADHGPQRSDSSSSPAVSSQRGGYLLPLAPDTLGLARPRFPTVRLCVSAGVMWSDLSDIARITNNASGASIPLSIGIGVPLWEGPDIEFFGGWSTFPVDVAGGTLKSFWSSILLRPSGFVPFGPIIGVGGGSTSFGLDGATVVVATGSYPLITAGVTLAPHTLDLLVMVPLAEKVHKVFESQEYVIRPSGPMVSLFLSF